MIENLSILSIPLVGRHPVVIVDFHNSVAFFRTPTSANMAIEKVPEIARYKMSCFSVVVTMENCSYIIGRFKKLHHLFSLFYFIRLVHSMRRPTIHLGFALGYVYEDENPRG